MIVVECSGLFAEMYVENLTWLADLWAGQTVTPAGELFEIIIESILDQATEVPS